GGVVTSYTSLRATASSAVHTLSLHDALPISGRPAAVGLPGAFRSFYSSPLCFPLCSSCSVHDLPVMHFAGACEWCMHHAGSKKRHQNKKAFLFTTFAYVLRQKLL